MWVQYSCHGHSARRCWGEAGGGPASWKCCPAQPASAIARPRTSARAARRMAISFRSVFKEVPNPVRGDRRNDAALGDERGDQLGGGHVERRVRDLDALRGPALSAET